MNKLIIVGAGMAGLLAANLLRHRNPIVYESASSLPNNHSALLRFRTPLVGEVLGIPFKKVKVTKSTLPWKNPVADSLSYSFKNLGVYRSDRSLSHKTEVVDRWIAPHNLVSRMARGVDIVYGKKYDFSEGGKVISTIPMPDLMRALGGDPSHEFAYFPGTNVTAKIDDCDCYVSLAVPNPGYPFSRVSITGNEMIVEVSHSFMKPQGNLIQQIADWAVDMTGINRTHLSNVKAHEQRYAKIAPINEDYRKGFIHHASSILGKAFSLGRFATWRPGLLMDDLVQDIRKIDSWIDSGSSGYDMDVHSRR